MTERAARLWHPWPRINRAPCAVIPRAVERAAWRLSAEGPGVLSSLRRLREHPG